MVSSIRTVYFGRQWAIPVFDRGRKVHRTNTPIGQPCARCDVPVRQYEFGLMRPHGTIWRPIHAECKLVDDVGGINHVRKVCRCYVRTPGYKPPVFTGTRREEALAVWAHVQQMRAAVHLEPL